jgi:hypothetical protein
MALVLFSDENLNIYNYHNLHDVSSKHYPFDGRLTERARSNNCWSFLAPDWSGVFRWQETFAGAIGI